MSTLRNEAPKIHIVAVSFPAQGTLSPMMQLCKFIASQEGFTVSFISIDSVHEEMMKHWEAPDGLDLHLVSVPFSWKSPRGLDADIGIKSQGQWYLDSEKELIPAVSDLVGELASKFGTVSCILSDYFFHWAPDVANKLGIRCAVLWPANAAWVTMEYHIPQMIRKGHIFPKVEETIIDYIGGLAPLPLSAVPAWYSIDNEVLKETSIKRSLSIKKAEWVLVNSFYDLERETFDFLRSELGNKSVPAGPMFLLNESIAAGPTNLVLRSHDTGYKEWLDRQEKGSVLYVSFGSLAVLSIEQFDELAAALEMSKKPLLWIIRSEVIKGLPKEKYDNLIERTKSRAYIASWVPQPQVLAHSSIGAFLTHCGWNSIMESICNGVPMIGWPYAVEQNTNCRLIEHDWKVGMSLAEDSQSKLIMKEEIERGISRVMGNEEMKRRAQDLMRLGRKAVDRKEGLSYSNLMSFLDDLKHKETNPIM